MSAFLFDRPQCGSFREPEFCAAAFGFLLFARQPLAQRRHQKVIEEAPQKAVPNARGYYVVGGAFAEKANADRMVTKLQEKGYNSFIFQKSGRLHMVCYGHFEKKSEARKALRSIKSNENASVWLKRL